jgi:hypothetical protein
MPRWRRWIEFGRAALHRRDNAIQPGETIMSKTVFAAPLAVLCLLSPGLLPPALAGDAPPDTDHGRYTLNKVADGYLRLDTQTGDVSLCAQKTVGWACQAVADDRAVFEQEIARLRGENGALKKEILANNLPLPAGAANAAPDTSATGDATVTLRLPSDSEVDSAVAYVGRIWHRFVDALSRAQKQMLNKS